VHSIISEVIVFIVLISNNVISSGEVFQKNVKIKASDCPKKLVFDHAVERFDYL